MSTENKEKEEKLLIQSFIDVPLWDRAGWGGLCFVRPPRRKLPPLLGLMFRDIEVGKQIFQQWKETLGGDEDKYDELKISIIEGEIPNQEAGYSVVITSDLAQTEIRAKAQGQEFDYTKFFTFSRIHRMNPSADSKNLENFKADLSEANGAYILSPTTFMPSNFEKDVFQYGDFGFGKRRISFMNVADIRTTDIESIVLKQPEQML
jgi:hypothetical protein